MNIATKSIISGLLFLIAIFFGIWVTRSGRPLVTSTFTVHKLAAIGAAVFAVLIAVDVFKMPPVAQAFWLVLIAGGISILALFVTGALLSLEKQTNGLVLILHVLSTIFTAASVIAAAYMLLKQKLN